MTRLRPLLLDASIALGVVLAASLLGVLVNLSAGWGIDPFAAYTGYGKAPPPTAEDPYPLPPVGLTGPLPVSEALGRIGHVLFVDTRSAEAFQAGHIPGAVSVPYSIRRMMPAEAGGGYTDDEVTTLKAACVVVLYDAGDGSAESVQSGLRERLPVLRILSDGRPDDDRGKQDAIAAWKAAGGAWRGEGGG